MDEDSHTITAEVSDPAGNNSTETLIVIVDRTDPSIEFTHTDPWYTNGDPVVLQGTVGDNRPLDELTVTVGGESVQQNAQGDWQVSLNLDENSHTITAEVSDPAGNNSTETLTVIVDRTGPQTAVSSDSTIYHTSPIRFTVSFGDSVYGFEEDDIEVEVNNNLVTEGAIHSFNVVNPRIYRFSVIPNSAGEVVVTVPAGSGNDIYGNGNVGHSRTIEYDPPVLTPIFSASVDSGHVPLEVLFTDESTQGVYPIAEWEWDFGNGEVRDSQGPHTITYSDTGRFDVTLRISDSYGGSRDTTYLDFIQVDVGPTANFGIVGDGIGNDSLTVEFVDHSTQGTYPIAEWEWDFGNGEEGLVYDSAGEPSDIFHTYMLEEDEDEKTFSVMLRIYDTQGNQDSLMISDYIFVSKEMPRSIFTISPNPLDGGVAKETQYRFTDSSRPFEENAITRWVWDFGDGDTVEVVDSNATEVTHTYMDPGYFRVRLTVYDERGTSYQDMKTGEDKVVVKAQPPTANFELIEPSSATGILPLYIEFDASASTSGSYPIQSYTWNFGDDTGGHDGGDKMSHVYTSEGTYQATVTLCDSLDNCHESSAVQIEISPFSIKEGSAQSDYHLISVPYRLDNASVSETIGDDFGDYDPEKWRLWDYVSQGNAFNRDYYIEYGSDGFAGNFSQGKSLFLIVRGSSDKELDFGQVNLTTDLEKIIRLNSGWNLIGNPYHRSVNWPETNGVETPRLYSDGQFQNKTSLEPWQGYAVRNTTSSEITVTISAPDGNEVSEPFFNLEHFDWLTELSLSMGESRDQYNHIGMLAEDQSQLKSHYCLSEIPPFFSSISLNFSGDKCADIRSPLDESKEWNLEIQSSESGEALLSWRYMVDPPENPRLYLINDLTKEQVDMAEKSEYIFSIGEGTNHLRIVYGDPGEMTQVIPDHVDLTQNYPNPFNPYTRIRYGLPTSSHAKLSVYSVTGQLVRVLTDEEQEAGYHTARWDGKNSLGSHVSSGVYFYVLSVDGQPLKKRKMALIK
ncbi:MAG: hypothetical protein B6244_07230 [Candidatus Cloacimonetes bacterium 4572_55]|nr:MAG: hypothetical protein B6244_07230 [Candidatus Cloacimonetes bacterium 4572_55]